MEVKTKAIVLRTVKYGDQSLIIDMITRDAGRVSFIARIPKTQRGKMKKQLFQPMTILEIVYNQNQRQSLQHMRDVRIGVPFTSISLDPSKMCVTMFLAEFLTYATRDEQRNEPLFAFLEAALRWLDAAKSGYANFHLVFLMRLSRFIGIMPNVNAYTPGCVFDLREGRFSGVVPLHGDFLSPQESALIPRLGRMDFSNMRLFRMNHDQRNRITEVLLQYYRLHIPEMPELRSFDVVKEIF